VVDYAGYLSTTQRCRSANPCDPNFLELPLFLVDYPIAHHLYPGALEAIQDLRHRGFVPLRSGRATHGGRLIDNKRIQ